MHKNVEKYQDYFDDDDVLESIEDVIDDDGSEYEDYFE